MKFYKFSRFDNRYLFAISVTRLGDFWKLLLTNLHAKAAQIFGHTLGSFEKCNFLSRNCFCHFLGNIWQFFTIFYSYLWSHCLPSKMNRTEEGEVIEKFLNGPLQNDLMPSLLFTTIPRVIHLPANLIFVLQSASLKPVICCSSRSSIMLSLVRPPLTERPTLVFLRQEWFRLK